MKIFLSLILFFVSFSVNNFAYGHIYSETSVKNWVTRTPRRVENSMSSLVSHLTKPFDNDYNKAQAIAYWIAMRIHYDQYLYNNNEATYLRYNYRPQKPTELLKSRAGICVDFTNLFYAMTRKANIRSKRIKGYVYQKSGRSRRLSSPKDRRDSLHAWNAFYYRGKKIYVDTTFMAGGRVETKRRISETNRRRALNKLKRANRLKSVKNDFDTFYFGFTYEDEKRQTGYIREEL